jgi:hypothetical protein
VTSFWVKNTVSLGELAKKKFFIYSDFVLFVATRKGRPTNFPPSLLLLLLDPVSEIRDRGYGMDKSPNTG